MHSSSNVALVLFYVDIVWCHYLTVQFFHGWNEPLALPWFMTSYAQVYNESPNVVCSALILAGRSSLVDCLVTFNYK